MIMVNDLRSSEPSPRLRAMHDDIDYGVPKVLANAYQRGDEVFSDSSCVE